MYISINAVVAHRIWRRAAAAGDPIRFRILALLQARVWCFRNVNYRTSRLYHMLWCIQNTYKMTTRVESAPAHEHFGGFSRGDGGTDRLF